MAHVGVFVSLVIRNEASPMKESTFHNLPEEGKQLLLAASDAKERAYNPYSNFFVGSALMTTTGEIVVGCNMENASYGCTICAERAALLKANTEGFRQFTAAAIIARGAEFDTTEVTAPCGACRQMLFEASQLAGHDIRLYLSTTKMDKVVITSIEELFPLGFGPKDLGIDVTHLTHP